MAAQFGADRRGFLGGALAAAGMAATPLRAEMRVAPPDLTLTAPDGRAIAVTVLEPVGRPRGIILFSHGAGSAPRFYDALFSPWRAAGFRVLAPLHVDSTDHPQTAAFPGLASWKARIEDMRALLAHIGKAPFVAAGHSYGGLVALTMGGAQGVPPQGWTGPFYPRLARSVLAFSPPAPIPVLVTPAGYGALAVPALIQTGTRDIVPGITTTDGDGWKGHLAPFDAAAPGRDRFGLVLDGVDHYFGGAICRYDLPGPRQIDGLAAATRVAGLFLDGYGAGQRNARRMLAALVTDKLPVRLLRK